MDPGKGNWGQGSVAHCWVHSAGLGCCLLPSLRLCSQVQLEGPTDHPALWRVLNTEDWATGQGRRWKLSIFHFCSALPKLLCSFPQSHPGWIGSVPPPCPVSVKCDSPRWNIFGTYRGRGLYICKELLFFRSVIHKLILYISKVIFKRPFPPFENWAPLFVFLATFSHESLTLLTCVIFSLSAKTRDFQMCTSSIYPPSGNVTTTYVLCFWRIQHCGKM